MVAYEILHTTEDQLQLCWLSGVTRAAQLMCCHVKNLIECSEVLMVTIQSIKPERIGAQCSEDGGDGSGQVMCHAQKMRL